MVVRVRILVQVTIYRRLLIGRGGHVMNDAVRQELADYVNARLSGVCKETCDRKSTCGQTHDPYIIVIVS